MYATPQVFQAVAPELFLPVTWENIHKMLDSAHVRKQQDFQKIHRKQVGVLMTFLTVRSEKMQRKWLSEKPALLCVSPPDHPGAKTALGSP